MHEAFWNGLFDVRWEEAPLGAEAIRLTVRLRERGYAARTRRDYGHAVVHLGRFLHEELESDRVRDEGVVADLLAGHLPGRRCYRRPPGRREEPARRWHASKASSNGSKTSEPPKVMLSSVQSGILLTPANPDSQTPRQGGPSRAFT